jgi:hypothetical protein
VTSFTRNSKNRNHTICIRMTCSMFMGYLVGTGWKLKKLKQVGAFPCIFDRREGWDWSLFTFNQSVTFSKSERLISLPGSTESCEEAKIWVYRVLLSLDSWVNRWYKLGTTTGQVWNLVEPRKWFHFYWRGSRLLGTVRLPI